MRVSQSRTRQHHVGPPDHHMGPPDHVGLPRNDVGPSDHHVGLTAQPDVGTCAWAATRARSPHPGGAGGVRRTRPGSAPVGMACLEPHSAGHSRRAGIVSRAANATPSPRPGRPACRSRAHGNTSQARPPWNHS